MTFTDFVHLPPAVFLLVVVMLWPAIWAAAGLTTAFVGDISRWARRRHDVVVCVSKPPDAGPRQGPRESFASTRHR
jgi:hypothetical protein